jgi:hypothetical protein
VGSFCGGAGGTCAPKLGNGSACTGVGDCQTGFCIDGVCCEVACTDQCRRCEAQTGRCVNQTGQDTNSIPPCVTPNRCIGNGNCQ